VGLTVDLEGTVFTITGVLKRGFAFAPRGNSELWVRLNSLSTHEKMRTFYEFWRIGRPLSWFVYPCPRSPPR
jgi:hypothetical protein